MHWLGKRAAILIIAGMIGFYPQKVAGKPPEGNEPLAANTREARIENTARIITVKIKRKSGLSDKKAFAGTGFIVSVAESDKNTYYVLTAKHVVKLENIYEVVTPDGKSHQVEYSNIVLADGDVDLAMLRFTSSDKDYVRTCVGNSDGLSIDTSVYLYGWVKSGQSAKKKKLSKGKIIQIIKKPIQQEGYSLIYSNEAFNGMSGGPLLREDGCVVGIHGRRRPYGPFGKAYLGISINKGRSLLEAYKPKYSLESPDNLWVADQEKKRASEQAETAALPEEWRSVMSRWEMALALLEEVPENHSKYKDAQKLIKEYQRELKKVVKELEKVAEKEKDRASEQAETSKSPEEWRSVMSGWEMAIALLEEVRENHPRYRNVQRRIEDYREELNNTREELEKSEAEIPVPEIIRAAYNEKLKAEIAWREAKIPGQWEDVLSSWSKAIELLIKVPESNSQYEDIQREIFQERQNLKYIQGMLEKSKELAPKEVPDPYFMGIKEGEEAKRLRILLPNSREEWTKIAEHLRTALKWLEEVPGNHPRYQDAQKSISEYNEILQDVKKRGRIW